MNIGGNNSYIDLMDNVALLKEALSLLESKERNEDDIKKFKKELEIKIEENMKAMNDYDKWVDAKAREAEGEDYEGIL